MPFNTSTQTPSPQHQLNRIESVTDNTFAICSVNVPPGQQFNQSQTAAAGASCTVTITPGSTQQVWLTQVVFTTGTVATAATVIATITGLIGGTQSFQVTGSAAGQAIVIPNTYVGAVGTAVVITIPAITGSATAIAATGGIA